MVDGCVAGTFGVGCVKVGEGVGNSVLVVCGEAEGCGVGDGPVEVLGVDPPMDGEIFSAELTAVVLIDMPSDDVNPHGAIFSGNDQT